ncbi:MAG TPA: amino acid--tRNA ligase-related protein, partial [Anaeromyxobacter sp.]
MNPPRANAYRDTWSGEIDASRAGDTVRAAGWVHRRRDHGGLIFIDLRDRTGIVQLVFHPDRAPDAHARAHRLRSEDVISATGAVVRREEANVNPNIPTGEIEITVADWELLADAETPPFPIDEDGPVDEGLRLQNRALDIRRPRMRANLELRHRVVQAIRGEMEARDFLDVETPILTRSTPEGARDFLVPARTNPGSFFALPQSPQLFKQLLMVGGLERYYQIARCFRDEDLRRDRQPEFTQVDVEASFIDEEFVYGLIEGLFAEIFPMAGIACQPPFPRMKWQ